jgi:Mob1/phocein family.
MKHAAATLGSGNLRLAVMLPEGEDLNEWVAVNSKWLCPARLPHPIVKYMNSILNAGMLFQGNTVLA